MTVAYAASTETGIWHTGELMFRSNHLFQQVDGIYLHLQIETPKLTRENIACGFVLQLSVQCASGDHTDSRSTADKQLLPPLLIFAFFGYTICDTQNTKLEANRAHSRTQHRR